MVVGFALILGLGSACSFAQTNKPKVAPLSDSDRKLKKCELHGNALQLGTAVVLYGKRGAIVPQLVASRQFPHASSYVFGGCVLSTDSPHLKEVKFCPQCRQAEKRWFAAHKPHLPQS